MQLVVLGLNHRSAPVDVREKFSFSKEALDHAMDHIYAHEEVEECVLLSTCNRTELYVVLNDMENVKEYMIRLLLHLKGEETVDVDEKWFFLYEGKACISHLFRVASSLDSLVLGEGQILSQLKMAYISSYSKGLTASVFNIIFQKAIAVGKRVRTMTGIANTPVSVSYTAVNLAEDSLDIPISEAKVLILGAGQMSELTARHLQAKGVKSIFVSNRTFKTAEELAKQFNGKAVDFDNFVEEIPGVYLFNIDALESVVEANKHQREEEARKAEPILEEALQEIEEKLQYLSVRPIMVLLSEKAEAIRKREVHRAMAKLPNATELERKIISNMSRMLVRKLLRDPMIHFGEVAGKEEERDYWKLFQDMFALEVEDDTL